MKRKSLGFVLFVVLCCCAVDGNCGSKAPLPAKLLNAKTVYLDETFLVCTGLWEKEIYKELAKWKRVTLVDNDKKADLIFSLTITQEYTQSPWGGPSSDDTYYLTALDATNGEVLWRSSIFTTAGKVNTPNPVRDLIRQLRKRVEKEASPDTR